MLDFATPHSTYEPVGENRGRFIVEPLARGFGYTFGNSLRRVLLSSLEGAAISAVKVDRGRTRVLDGAARQGRCHRHHPQPQEDRLRPSRRSRRSRSQLVKDGPAMVTAADIQLPAAVEVMDPDAYIATLEDGGRLEMQLTVRRGRGYASADDNKPDDDHPGPDPHRLHLLAGAAGRLQGGAGARGPAHGLRQADAGSGDQRGARPEVGRGEGRRPAS